MPKVHKHIAALDTAPQRCAGRGEVTENDQLEIIGIGRSPSRGVRKGVVVNIELSVEA